MRVQLLVALFVLIATAESYYGVSRDENLDNDLLEDEFQDYRKQYRGLPEEFYEPEHDDDEEEDETREDEEYINNDSDDNDEDLRRYNNNLGNLEEKSENEFEENSARQEEEVEEEINKDVKEIKKQVLASEPVKKELSKSQLQQQQQQKKEEEAKDGEQKKVIHTDDATKGKRKSYRRRKAIGYRGYHGYRRIGARRGYAQRFRMHVSQKRCKKVCVIVRSNRRTRKRRICFCMPHH